MDTSDPNGTSASKASTGTSVQPIAPVIPSVDAAVRLIGRPHPLRTEVFECQMVEGQTIAQMLTGLNDSHLSVRVNGHRINREAWTCVRPKAGTVVEVVSLPQSNMSKETSKAVGTAAAVALAIIVTIVTYGVGSGIAAAGVSAATAAAIGSAAGAVVGIAGQLLIGALIKPPAPREKGVLAEANKAFGISSNQNEARPYGVVPCVIGDHRMFPPLTAIPDVYRFGLSQFIRFLFDCGYGNLTLSDLRLGNDDVEDFDGLSYATGTAPALYSNDIAELVAGQPLPTNLPKTATQRTSSAGADELEIGIQWPAGFFAIDTENKLRVIATQLEIEFSLSGSGVWTRLADYELSNPTDVRVIPALDNRSTNMNGDPLGYQIYQVNSSSRDPLFYNISWKVPVAGQYHVRVGRSDNGYNDQDWTKMADPDGAGPAGMEPAPTGGVVEIVDYMPEWTVLKTIKYTTPNTLSTTKIAMRLLATPRLNGVVNQLNLRVRQNIPVWNGVDAWVVGHSSNPAYIFRWLLTSCPGNPRPISTSRIDDDRIKLWAAHCTSKGFVFNAVVETGMTMFQLLQDICAAGRATLTVRDGKYSVVMDTLQSTPVQHFTPRNSSGFNGSRMFGDTIHALKCRFVNPAANYQPDERLVPDAGYTEETATKVETFDMRGVTDPDAVWKLAKYHMAVARLRQTEYSWKTDIEHLVCQRGDLVKVTHDLTHWGLGSGRIKHREVANRVWAEGAFPARDYDSHDISDVGTPVTVGVRFVTDNPAVITGASFIRPAAIALTVKLWSISGTLLATATTGTTGNSVAFDAPVLLAAGSYVLTYYSSNGLVAYTVGLHNATTYQSEPITIPADGTGSEKTGRLNYADAFPTNGTTGSHGVDGFFIQPLLLSDVGTGDVQSIALDERPEVYDTTQYAVRVRKDTGATSYTTVRPRNLIYNPGSTLVRATSTGMYRGEDGALVAVVGTNSFRHQFGFDGERQGILIEAGRVNEMPWSNDFTQAQWVKTNSGVTANQTQCPDLTSLADKFVDGGSNAAHTMRLSLAATNNTNRTFSVFAKAGERPRLSIFLQGNDIAATGQATFDLSTGTVVGGSGFIEPWYDGWFRCSVSIAVGTGAQSAYVDLHLLDADGTYAAPAHAPVSGYGLYLAHGQVEAGGLTSLLPTSAGTSLRNSDLVTTTLASVDGFNSTAWTVVVEFRSTDSIGVTPVFTVDDGSNLNRIGLYDAGSGWRFGNPSSGAPAVLAARGAGSVHRAAVSMAKSGGTLNLRASMNGAAVATGTEDSFTATTFRIGADQAGNCLDGTISKLVLIPRVLTDAELQSISVVGSSLVEADLLTLVTPQAGVKDGDLTMIGASGQESINLIVTKIAPDSDMGATISAVDEAPGVYTADDGVIPAFVSEITGRAYADAPDPPVLTGVLNVDPVIPAGDLSGVLRNCMLGIEPII